MQRRISLILVAILLGGLFYGCSSKKEGKEEEKERVESSKLLQEEKKEVTEDEEERSLKIGVIGPETGEEADYGLKIIEGVMMAAKEINAKGGIFGKEIEIIHYDNKNSPELTEEITYNLIQEKVIAILAAPTGWSTFAPTHLANETHTILISIGTRRRIERSGPYIFRSSLPDESAIDELIRFAVKELAYTNYALITSSNYDYSLELSALFKMAVLKHRGSIGLETDTYDTYSGKVDLKGVVREIKNAPKPLHAIIYTGGVEEGVNLAVELRRVGLELPIIGGEDLFTEGYLRKGGKAVRGTLLYTTFSPDDDSPGVAGFVENYKRKMGKTPDRFVALAYDTLMFLGEAIRKAGSTHPSRVRDALLSIKDFEGVTGRLGFTPEGGPIKEAFIYRVEGERFVLVN